MDAQPDSKRKNEVNRSFRDKYWTVTGCDVEDLRSRILHIRGVKDIDAFCNPKIRDSMPNPDGLANLDKFLDVIVSSKLIGIFGDYDVDGITSTVMWHKFLNEIGIESVVYIPNRNDGYGASEVGISSLVNKGVDTILFLDCGSSSIELLEAIPTRVCILDHHQCKEVPKVDAVINPHYEGARHEEIYKTLCTAGLSFLVLAKLGRRFEKNCMSLLDLSAIGTLGDMMEMNNFNRACIKRGLEFVNSMSNPGLNALIEELNLKFPIHAGHMAFYIIPCLNAAGRIASAQISFDLLTTQDHEHARYLAKTLKSLNMQRKEIEEQIVQEAIMSVDNSNAGIIVKNADWHPGVVGIIASRIKDIYSKTCFVLYKNSGVWKGSARGHMVNVGQVIRASVASGNAMCGGGHFAAGGVSVCETKMLDWEEWIHQKLNDAEAEVDDAIYADAEIFEPQLGKVVTLCDLGPFGNGNAVPKIVLKETWLRSVFVGKNYVKCTLNSGMTIMGFRFSADFCEKLVSAQGRYVDMLLSVDESGSIKLEDMRYSIV